MMDYRATIGGLLHKTGQEWGENKRLQVLTMLGVLLVLIWGHHSLDEWRLEVRKKAIDARVELSDREAVVGEKIWLAREKEASELANEARKMIWLASSEGEAEALIRDWISVTAKAVGLDSDRVSVELDRKVSDKKYRPVRVEMQGVYKAEVWQRFIQAISQNQPDFLVEFDEINLTNKRRYRYRLGFTAWFKMKDDDAIVAGERVSS